jgi:mono/diheme cytochrome c family protein
MDFGDGAANVVSLWVESEMNQRNKMSKQLGCPASHLPMLRSWSCALAIVLAPSSCCLAADASQGKALANRWCAGCHLVERGAAGAQGRAPPFTYLARTPEFDENKLAFLLLQPHPNMPDVALSRSEVADMADYIATLR